MKLAAMVEAFLLQRFEQALQLLIEMPSDESARDAAFVRAEPFLIF